MSGSFWKFSNGFTSLSNVSTLLEQYNSERNDIDTDSEDLNPSDASTDNENSTHSVLLRLLDESDLLQELLSNNSMLLEFLRDEKVLGLLVGLIVNEGKSSKSILSAEQTEDNSTKESELEQADSKDDEKISSSEENLDAEISKVDEELNEKDSSLNEHEKEKANDDENEATNEKETDSTKETLDDAMVADDDLNEKDEEDDPTSIKEDNEDDSSSANDSVDNNEEDEDEDAETDEEKKTRHATLAAEILASDVWSLTDTVMESITSLNTLWCILESKEPLSINLSTYFMKIMEHLLDMKCDEMITYLIDNQPNLVSKFMNHLSNPPLMDFLLKLISTDKPDNSTGIIDFLQNQGLINHLIQSLDITKDTEQDTGDALLRQSSAADFLKALITISANSTTDNSNIGPNELTRELVSYEQMTNLCNIMLKGDYALANGVGIIIEIIRKNNSDYDLLPVLYITLESHPPTGRDPIYLGHLLKVFGDKIDEFNKLLLKSPVFDHDGEADDETSPKTARLKTPFGEIEPLGFERFKICELIAELLHCSNMALLNDNKGFDIVKERDDLREKMKEYDPISFKYNEVIVLPSDFERSKPKPSAEGAEDEDVASDLKRLQVNEIEHEQELENFGNDTVDSFNSKDDDEIDVDVDDFQNEMNEKAKNNEDEEEEEDEEETHANANLTEDQIRAKPVIGDFLKISLYDTQIISNILAMFFKFPWNNFLHNVVFDIVQQVLNGSMDIGFNKFLAMDLFDRGDITNKIINGQKDCTEYESTNNGLRLGYMGHLTLIAEEVVKFIQLYPSNTLSELIDVKVEDEVWEEYVSHVLYDTREKYNAILGGGEDEDDDEEEDEEASNTFDEGAGEILEDKNSPPVNVSLEGLFDPDAAEDYSLIESGYEDYRTNEHEEDIEKHEESTELDVDAKTEAKQATARTSSSSDESESEEDDDHFSNYMSSQLSNADSKLPSPTTKMSDDEDEESSEEESEYIRGKITSPPKYTPNTSTKTTNVSVPAPVTNDDDDEYIDPNDDGLSYKKNDHPLYDSKGHLINVGDGEEDDELSEDSSSSSSDDDELIDDSSFRKAKDDKDSGNKLTRAASKS